MSLLCPLLESLNAEGTAELVPAKQGGRRGTCVQHHSRKQCSHTRGGSASQREAGQQVAC